MALKKFGFKMELMSDINQNRFFLIGTYTVLGLVSAFMTIMNFMTNQKEYLTICTGLFAILCVVNIILSLFNDSSRKFAKFLFSVEILCMFTFFLVSGNPEGFSVIWICMLPSVGMFFFNRIGGSVLCAIMFCILVFFLWTPLGRGFLLYDYTVSFQMRFPVLFVAFHFAAFFLETLRDNAYRETRRMQKYYHDLSLRDALTEVFNRQGLYSTLEEESKFTTISNLGVALFDIDNFKKINDTYGHDIGDEVLKTLAALMDSMLSGTVCRWGGEEFVSVFTDGSVTIEDLDKLRKTIQAHEFTAEGETFHVTVSIGLCTADNVSTKQIDRLIANADDALYYAKNHGKNQIIPYTDLPKTETESPASV